MNYDTTLTTNSKLLAAPAMQRILSYLGELKAGESVPVMRVAADLDLPYGSCAEHIRYLHSLQYVAVTKTATKSLVCLNALLDPAVAAKVVVEWQDSFGAHPTSGRAQRRIQVGE
jgi:hypothetical protein